MYSFKARTSAAVALPRFTMASACLREKNSAARAPGITIAEATESFLANRQNRGIETSTLVKYRTFVKQLRAHCGSRGYSQLDQLTVTDMDRFYASWADGKRA